MFFAAENTLQALKGQTQSCNQTFVYLCKRTINFIPTIINRKHIVINIGDPYKLHFVSVIVTSLTRFLPINRNVMGFFYERVLLRSINEVEMLFISNTTENMMLYTSEMHINYVIFEVLKHH